MKTVRIKVEVAKSEMAFVDEIFKAYEGLAMVTILGGERGLIELKLSPSTKEDVLAILDDLADKIELKILQIIE